MLMLGMMLAAGCGKDKTEEPGTNPENPTGGIAWPERRVSHIDSPVNKLTYDFTWQDGKVKEIVCVSYDKSDSMRYSFTYDNDKIATTHYEYFEHNKIPLIADFVNVYSGGKITKVKIIPESWTDDEHTTYFSMTYTDNKLSKAELTAWSHNFYTDENGTTETWEESQPIMYTFRWTDDDISSMAISFSNDAGEINGLEYDNHPNPICLPLGPIESLSLRLLEDYMFGLDDDGRFMSNMLWNGHNITSFPHCKIRHINDGETFNATFRYDYDAAGLYPTTMYLAKPDGTEQVFMTFTYEN